MTDRPRSLIDEERYPIEGAGSRTVVEAAQLGLDRDGVAVLDGFLRPEAVELICVETRELARTGHHSVVSGTPYLGLPDETVPLGHPARHEVRSALTAVAYDLFPTDAALRSLYEWDPLLEFIRRILAVDVLHRYADPFGALNLASMADGDELGWHFDQTDFVVSIALQSAERGGDFESATRIRSATDERYDAVAGVLAGSGGTPITTIPMRPGALMLFEGRHSMHRVTPVEGEVARHVALLAYDTRPDTNSSELLKLVRYGRLP